MLGNGIAKGKNTKLHKIIGKKNILIKKLFHLETK